MTRLTKRSVDALGAPKGEETIQWDSELKGFGVRARGSGSKTYLLQYRNLDGRTRRLNLGRHGSITPEEARQLAKQRLGEVAKGEDPAEERQAMRKGLTVAQLCDWYLENARSGRILGRRRRAIAHTTLAMDESRIEQHIKPLIGARALRTLSLWDVEGMQAAIVAGKTSKARGKGRGGVTTGGSGVASRAVGTLRSICGHALRVGLIDKNPAAGARLVASTPKSRALSVAEIKRVGAVMRELASEGEHPTALAAIRLALLTGLRRMEILGLQHTWVFGAEGYVRYPHTKTGPQLRPIGGAAADLIASQPRLVGSEWVFPADAGEGHFVGLPRVFERVCARAEIEGATLHTLRHTFASVAGNLNFSELTIAGLLGHAARGVTRSYVHLDQALVLAAEKVSAQIAGYLGELAAPATVSHRLAVNEDTDAAERLIALMS